METFFELMGYGQTEEKGTIAITQAKGTAYLLAQSLRGVYHNMTIYERKGKYPANKPGIGAPIEIREV